MSHRFKVGQLVRQFRFGPADAKSASGGLLEVIRLMPEDRSGEPSFRVKSAVGERAMREGELTLAS